jgi:MFS family permease
MLVGSNLPSPLYPTYQRAFGLSPLVVTLIFATYAATVMPSLVVFGPLGDALGRKRILVGALGAGILAAALFAAASSAAWLFGAQVAEGIAMGAVQGTAVAALIETEPNHNRSRASLIGSAATVGGTAAGPLFAGLIGQFGGSARQLPYLVEIGLLVGAGVFLTLVFREHTTKREPWRPRRPSLPRSIRRTFALASMSALVVWALTAVYLSLVPSYATELLETSNLALIGGLIAAMLGTSAIAQVAGRSISTVIGQIVGLGLLVAGAGALVAAAHIHDVWSLIAAAILSGAGQGLAFRGALAEVNAVAPEDRKGDVVATFYVLVYIGVAAGAVGVGLISLATGLLTAVQIFGSAIAAAGLIGIVALSVDSRRANRLS